MAYKAKVLDHYNNPRNVGAFDKNSEDVGTGMVGAPACGDVMKLQIKVKDGVIEDAKFKTFGCASAIASSSLATEWLKGKSLDEAMKIKNRDIANELELPPVKFHCSVLAEDAIKTAIADYKSKNAENDNNSSTQKISIIIDHQDNYGISITDNALNKIAEVLSNDMKKIAIRFIAKDGGCSGKKYAIELDENLESNHKNLGWKIQINKNGDFVIKHILIDCDSLDLLQGSEIDHEKNELGERFIFKNPNATSYCGCGKSFS
jgi:nitrogen fixation NifU-like protein